MIDSVTRGTRVTYECKCKDGHKMENNICVDVDECESVQCPTGSACNNLVGTFSCVALPGYKCFGEKCEDDTTCDRNPCIFADADHASCSGTTAGGVECECEDG